MQYARGSGAALLTAFLLLVVVPSFAVADMAVPPPPPLLTPAPDTYVTHDGITVANEVPKTASFVRPTLHGEDLSVVDTSWTIETMPWHYVSTGDTPSDRAVWVMFRGTQGELDGAPEAGNNYALTHHGLLGDATTTVTEAFGLSAFGDPDTPSETYTIAIAQIPPSKFVVTNILSVDENGTKTVEGYDAPYTDQDFINWFAGTDINGTQPEEVRTVEFEYIAGAAHVPCTQDCFSNVLFLPGIESSRLYRPDYNGGTDKLWEPLSNSDVQDLYMTDGGESVRTDIYTKERDVLDELPDGENIYKSFIAQMDTLKSGGKINDWEPIAYDWRLSLEDILSYGNDIDGRIYYSGDLRATSTPYVIQELRRLAATSKSGKVTIIAHSNGGLLAKALIEKLGSDASNLVDKVIFVASPQAGTPMAIAADLHGAEQSHGPFGLVTSEGTARTFASNSPMAYNLLPSAQYFTQVDDPVVEFDTSLPDWASKYGDLVHSQERLHDFLVDSFGRVDAQTGDTQQPIQLNGALLSSSETLHADLDNWTPPSGIQLIQIAGWGVPTIKGIAYTKGKSGGVQYELKDTIDGDGTVVVPSALWTDVDTGAQNYWVDLDDYNRKHFIEDLGPLLARNHGNILEIPGLINFLADNIQENLKPIFDYSDILSAAPENSNKRLRFTLHSPLTLDLYDDQGRHTGISTTTNQMEEQIPGTYYEEFGDVKYLYADESASFHIVMQGTGTGTFTFVVSELQGDAVVASTTFSNIPVTPQTEVRMALFYGLDSASDLAVDENGDGTTDSTYASSTGRLIVPPAPQEEPTAPSGGGGGGIPSLLPQATSTPPLVTSTSSVATSTPQLEHLTAATSSVTSSATTSVSHQKAKHPIVKIVQKTSPTAQQNTQVAAVAQSTGGGLWSTVLQWIIMKLHL